MGHIGLVTQISEMVPTIKIRSIFTTLNLDFLFKLNIIFYCYFNTILLKDHINHFP